MAHNDSFRPPETPQALADLLDAGVVGPEDMFDPDTPEERSPLYVAVEFGDHDLVDRLLKAGANPDGLAGHPDAPRPLYRAVADGHYPIVERLLAAGADPDALVGRAGSRRTALHACVDRNDGTLARLLLEAGADPEGSYGGQDRLDGTPLFIAALADSEDVIEPLIAFGAATAGCHAAPLDSAIEVACWFSSPGFVRRLLERGVDPNGKDPDGLPFLISASLISTEGCFRPPEDTLGCVQALLDAGADPNIRSRYGVTALIELAATVADRAPVDDDPDYHPSEEELARCVHDLVDLLIRYGADPELADAEGQCAAEIDPDLVAPAIAVATTRRGAVEAAVIGVGESNPDDPAI